MDQTARRHRIRLLSRLLGFALVAVAIIVPVVTVGVVATMSRGELAAGAQIDPARITTVSLGARLAIVALTALPALVFSYALVALLPALTELRRERFFSEAVLGGLKRFSGALLAATVLRLAVVPLTGMILSIGEAEGSMSITVGFDAILSVTLAAGVWLFAFLMAEASAVAAENREFV